MVECIESGFFTDKYILCGNFIVLETEKELVDLTTSDFVEKFHDVFNSVECLARRKFKNKYDNVYFDTIKGNEIIFGIELDNEPIGKITYDDYENDENLTLKIIKSEKK